MRLLHSIADMQTAENTAETGQLVTFEDKARQVLDLIADGRTLPSALEKVGVQMLSSNFIRAVKSRPELAHEYDVARVSQAAALADQMLDIADTERDSARARNMIDVRKWMAAKLDPRQFGDRLDLNIEQAVSIRSALDAAETRVLRPMRDLAQIVDAQVIDSTGESLAKPSDNESASPAQVPQRRDAGANDLDALLD